MEKPYPYVSLAASGWENQDVKVLRDHFAGQALAGSADNADEEPIDTARNCYALADAMLEARKESPGLDAFLASHRSMFSRAEAPSPASESRYSKAISRIRALLSKGAGS